MLPNVAKNHHHPAFGGKVPGFPACAPEGRYHTALRAEGSPPTSAGSQARKPVSLSISHQHSTINPAAPYTRTS